ncbi:MAG: hypothetical protein NTU53_10115 [Planctomycetota bacterium]|nr:hypothetical protein [Planctomycetota bacterium]
MKELQTKETSDKTKTRAKYRAEAPTHRTVLLAACVGVLIGLLLRR